MNLWCDLLYAGAVPCVLCAPRGRRGRSAAQRKHVYEPAQTARIPGWRDSQEQTSVCNWIRRWLRAQLIQPNSIRRAYFKHNSASTAHIAQVAVLCCHMVVRMTRGRRSGTDNGRCCANGMRAILWNDYLMMWCCLGTVLRRRILIYCDSLVWRYGTVEIYTEKSKKIISIC